MFYVLQVIHLLIILVLLFISLLFIVWQVLVLLWSNSRSCKAADGLTTMMILSYRLLIYRLEKDYWMFFLKYQSFDGNSILEVKYPKCKKDIQDIMEELCMNADRNILAIHTERCLNDLISVQCNLLIQNLIRKLICNLGITEQSVTAIWLSCHIQFQIFWR